MSQNLANRIAASKAEHQPDKPPALWILRPQKHKKTAAIRVSLLLFYALIVIFCFCPTGMMPVLFPVVLCAISKGF